MTTLEIYAVDAAGKQKKIKAEALRVVLPDGAELQILPDAEGLLIATPAEDFDPARLVLKPGAANAVRVAVERDGEAITELPEFNEIRDGELDLAVQYVTKPKGTPTKKLLKRWVKAALEAGVDASITLRIVDEDEGRALNRDYRGKDYATNVLSFAFNEGEPVPGMEGVVMGDLVLCAPVVAREADEQDKALEAHWAHLVIHGVLHLQAYDHLDDVEAEAMEALETAILQSLGYPDPYLAERDGAIDA